MIHQSVHLPAKARVDVVAHSQFSVVGLLDSSERSDGSFAFTEFKLFVNENSVGVARALIDGLREAVERFDSPAVPAYPSTPSPGDVVAS